MKGAVVMAFPLLLAQLLAVVPLAASGIAEQEVAFLSRREGNFDVYLRCRDGRELNLTSNPAQDYGMSWSPDGRRLVFSTARDANDEIYLLNLANGSLRNLTRNPAGDVQPAFSPDGKRIAFFSDREGDAPEIAERRELHVLTLASGEVRRLTTNSVYEELPSWTSDGKGIVFCRMRVRESARTAPRCDLWTVDAGGGGEKQLTAREGFNSGASTPPAGKPLLFHSREGAYQDLFALDPATGGVINLTRDSRQDWQPAWSADGAEIVWCAGQPPKNYDIWVMKADGTDRRVLIKGRDRDEWPLPRPPAAQGGPCAKPPR